MPGSICFVVVGSGRSGTKYAAELFTRLGIPCGHEAVFGWTPQTAGTLAGDASFLAVPFLETFDGAVYHQVRHPLAVLRSIMATRFFEDPGPYAPHLALIERFLPGVRDIEGALRRAMFFIVQWNLLCEPRARLRWRVETLDPPTLREASLLAGHARSLEECVAALDDVPKDVNRLETVGLRRTRLGWKDIPPSPEKDDLLGLAARYGYRPNPGESPIQRTGPPIARPG